MNTKQDEGNIVVINKIIPEQEINNDLDIKQSEEINNNQDINNQSKFISYFRPLKEKFNLFESYIHHKLNNSNNIANNYLKSFLDETANYDIGMKKQLCDLYFFLLDKNRSLKEPLFNYEEIQSYRLNAYFKRTLKELQKAYKEDFHYFKWYGIYIKGEDSINKLAIANKLLNNSDDEVLITMIDYRLNFLKSNIDQLLINDVDHDIKELMEIVSLVSNLKTKKQKVEYINICNKLTIQLNDYKMSKL